MGAAILILIGSIACLEWKYLKKNRRKPRTIRIVMGTAVFMALFLETIYWFREQWTLGMAIEALFGPIQNAMNAKK